MLCRTLAAYLSLVSLNFLLNPLSPSPLLYVNCSTQCVDNVTFLHLGFNNLRVIPKFGTRAKYSLKILNLRNNQLDNIDGRSTTKLIALCMGQLPMSSFK